MNVKQLPINLIIFFLNIACYLTLVNNAKIGQMKSSVSKSGTNLKELHKVKCTDNQNAPFDYYKLEKYDYNSKTYATCNVVQCRKIIDKMDKNIKKYKHYDSDHQEKAESYNYLIKLCSLDTLKSLSTDILKDYCSKIKTIADTETKSTEAISEHENVIANNEYYYEWMPTKNNMVVRSKNNLIESKVSVQFAQKVCNGELEQNEANYNRIISARNLKNELDSNLESFKNLASELKKLCDGIDDYDSSDKIIETAKQNHMDLVDSLEEHEPKMTRLSFNLKTYLKTYNEWDIVQHYPSELFNKFDEINENYKDNVKTKKEIRTKTVEKWNKFIETITSQLSQLSPTDKSQIEVALRHLSEYMSENLDIDKNDTEITSELESHNTHIKKLKAEINAIEQAHSKESNCIEVNYSVLNAVLAIQEQHFKEKAREFQNALVKFNNSKVEYVKIEDDSGMAKIKLDTDEFEKKTEKAKDSLSVLLNKILEFLKSIDQNVENLNQKGDDTFVLFNKLSPKKVDKPAAIIMPITTVRPTNGKTEKQDEESTPTSDGNAQSQNIGMIVGITLGIMALVLMIGIIISTKTINIDNQMFNRHTDI